MQKYTSQHSRKQALEKKHEQVMIAKIVGICIVCLIILTLIAMFAIPLMARIADMWGQVRNSDDTEETTKTALPLFRPQFYQLGFEATNSATIAVSGSAESGTTVTVSLNGQALTPVVTDTGGTFTLSAVSLREGINNLTAKADDGRGRTSESARDLSVTLDTSAPKLELSGPGQNETFSGNSQSVIEVKGTTEDASEVYVNEERALIGSDGKFSHRFLLNPGENNITIYAKDIAGNKSNEVYRKVQFNP